MEELGNESCCYVEGCLMEMGSCMGWDGIGWDVADGKRALDAVVWIAVMIPRWLRSYLSFVLISLSRGLGAYRIFLYY